MLVQLTLKNFKVFKEETLLDCIPGPINEHKASLIKDSADGELFLPVIAIYGPNGGGKSTVLYGLTYLAALVTSDNAQSYAAHPVSHRMDGACAHMPSEFDVLFRHKGFLFRYQLHLLEGAITQENLFYGHLGKDDAGILFNRKEADYHLGKTVASVSISQPSPSQPLLSLLARSSQAESIQAAFSWFQEMKILSSSPAVSGSHSWDRLLDAPLDPDICSLLQAMDLDITSYKVAANDTAAPQGTAPTIRLTHTPKESPSYELSYEDESEGTKKLLSILPAVLDSLRHGSLIVADDLDNLLHPHILRSLVNLYTNCEKNPHGAQLIFTSHNTAILTPAVLRRDEIWLCSRPSGQDAQLYPLSWYKKENGLIPRNDEAYGKQYLEGRYGASPDISI